MLRWFGALQVVWLLAAYTAVRAWLFESTDLGGAAYLEPVLALSAPYRLGAALPMALLGAPLLRWRACSWANLGEARDLRVVIGAAATILAFAFATYDYNTWVDQWHAADRVLLVALAAGVWLHPGFAAPAVIHGMAITHQFAHPMGAFSWTDKRIVFDLLVLFAVFLLLHAVTSRPHEPATLRPARGDRWQADWRGFLLVAFCLHGAHYAIPALGKTLMGWELNNELHRLFVVAHVNGWLSSWPDARVLETAALLRDLNPLLVGLTQVIEYAPLFVLLHRRTGIAIFIGCALLHIGIFVSSGIFFWKWVLLNGALALLLHRLHDRPLAKMFGLRAGFFVAAIPVFLTAPVTFRPVKLSWIDSGHANVYEIEALGESMRTYHVGRDFFAPYDMIFTQNRLSYLDPEPSLTLTYGATIRPDLGVALAEADSPDAALAVEAEHAEVHFDPRRAARFDAFMRAHFATINRDRYKRRVRWLRAPHHIWASASQDAYAAQERVVAIRVRNRTLWYDGQTLHVLRDRVVREIRIPETR